MIKFLKEKQKIGGLWARLAALLVVSLMTTAQMKAQTPTVTEDPASTYTPTNIINGTFDQVPWMDFYYKSMLYDGITKYDYDVDGIFATSSVKNGVDEGWNTSTLKVQRGILFEYQNNSLTEGGFTESGTGRHIYNWNPTNMNTQMSKATLDARGGFIECNAAEAATLYQDLTTFGGDVIRWSFLHGVRYDKWASDVQPMTVYVGAPNGTPTNTNPAIVEATLGKYYSNTGNDGHAEGEGRAYGNVDELKYLRLNKTNHATKFYTTAGIYIVPEGQTVTRFAFQSNADSPNGGNWMDDITFSTLIGNLHANLDDYGNVTITGYWGDADATKKLYVKVGETVNELDMTSVTNKNFKITFPKEKIGDATEVEIYHQDYEQAKRTVKIDPYKQVTNFDPKFQGGFQYTNGINPDLILDAAVFTDNGTTVNGSTRTVTKGQPITFKVPNGYKYYDGTTYDIYFKITSNIDMASPQWSVTKGNYFIRIPFGIVNKDFSMEMWLQRGNVVVDYIDVIGGSCYTGGNEGARPYSDDGYIYTNINNPANVWAWNADKSAWHSKDSYVTNFPDKYILGHGMSVDHTLKGGYYGDSGCGGEFVFGYITKNVTFRAESADGSTDTDVTFSYLNPDVFVNNVLKVPVNKAIGTLPTATPSTVDYWYINNDKTITYTAEQISAITVTADMTVTAVMMPAVCVNTTTNKQYATVQGGVNAAASEQTIKMLANSTENVTVNSGKAITLDLAGMVLKGTGGNAVITNKGTLTMTSSNTATLHYFTYVENGAWIHIPSPTPEQTSSAIAFASMEGETLESGATVISVPGGIVTGGTNHGILNQGGTAHLTMTGCSIVGNSGQWGGGLDNRENGMTSATNVNIIGNESTNYGASSINNDNGTLTYSGGCVSYNSHTGSGGIGGIGVCGDNGVTFTGVTISHNYSKAFGGGVGISAGSPYINLINCTVTKNVAVGNGGGVYLVSNGTVTVGGATVVKDNTTAGSTTASNFYLKDGQTITVGTGDKALASGANIGVTTQTAPTLGNPVAVTNNGSENDVPYFTSDRLIYEVKYDKDGHLELAEKDFNFNKITETACDIALDNENLSSDDAIFIAKKYLTKPYADTTFVAYKKYQGGENDMYGFVYFTNNKNYWDVLGRNMTLDDMKSDPEQSNVYHVIGIAKGAPTSDMFNFTASADLVYNGKAKAANVAANTEGVGDVTVKYYKDGDNTPLETAVLPGEYTVKIDVAEGDAYCVATDLTKDSWKFTITLSLEVTTLEDSNDPADGEISLREAITYANDNKADNDTITFAEALDGTITLTSDLPKVEYAYDIDGDKRITIDGDGHTIFVVDGPLGKVIGTAENPVVFDGLTITGGVGFDGGGNRYGGAVYTNRAFVTVKNSIISGNTAKYGAGICCMSDALAVTNSTFTGNNSSDKGGALYFGNNVNNNSATLVNNTIVGNTASSGAAICSEVADAVTTYNNLVVSNGTSASNQLSGVSFTEGGCNYMTTTATSVFRNALPTGSGSWLTWIPELVSSNKDVVNKGSESEIVKTAFGVSGDDWTGVSDNYGNPRIGEPTYHTSNQSIDIGSCESRGLTVTVLRNRPYGTVEITNGTQVRSDEYMVTATFDNGVKAKLTATPLSDEYAFVWWSAADDTTQVVSTSNPYVFDVVKDTTFKAVFVSEVAVNIYANPIDGGEVKIYDNKNGKYLDETERQHIKYGTSVTVEANAHNESDFAFAGWFNKATGEYFSKTQKFTFDAKQDLELEARFTDQVIWVRVKK